MGQFLIASSEYFGLYDAVQKYSHYPESDSDSNSWYPLSPSRESESESISTSVAKSQCYINTFVIKTTTLHLFFFIHTVMYADNANLFESGANWSQNPFPVKFILAIIKIKVYLIHFGRIYNRLGVNIPLHFL